MLSLATIKTAILRRCDAARSDFVGWPPTPQAAAESWAAAATAYFGELTNPALSPEPEAMLDACEAAFVAAALEEADGAGRLTRESLPTGFYAYALALLPLPTYASTPPLVPFSWPDGFGVPTSDPNVFAVLLSGLVNVWARTGTASIPPDVPKPWS